MPVVVAGNAVDLAGTPWAKLGVSGEAPLLLCDAERRFLGPLLAQAGGVSFGQPSGGLRLRVIVLDPNQRVAATFDSRSWPRRRGHGGDRRLRARHRRRRSDAAHADGARPGTAALLRAEFCTS